jgi:hypothetical protein
VVLPGSEGAAQLEPKRPRLAVDCRTWSYESWGNNWGNMSHRFQPISADHDLPETA